MSAPLLEPSSVDALKRALLDAFPKVKSSHLSEALASALGFQTQAALKAELGRPATVHPTATLNVQLLRKRLSQFGYHEDDPFNVVQAKLEEQFPGWIESDAMATERMVAVVGFDRLNLEAAIDAVMRSAAEKDQDITFSLRTVEPVDLRDRDQVRKHIVEKVRERYEEAKKRPGGVRIARIEDLVYSPVGYVFERHVGEVHPRPFGVNDGETIGHLAYFWSVL